MSSPFHRDFADDDLIESIRLGVSPEELRRRRLAEARARMAPAVEAFKKANATHRNGKPRYPAKLFRGEKE